MRIKITKIKELEDALHPNNIVEGSEREGEFSEAPIVGECFWMQYEKDVDSWFRTSVVIEIIDENTFRTLNSIYRYEPINEKDDEQNA